MTVPAPGLLACPFCGYGMEPSESDPLEHVYGEHGDASERPDDMPYSTYVSCGRCDANGPTCNGDAAAIAAWNRRPTSPASANVARLVESQANDARLWFSPVYATEAVLQRALRDLHAAIEGKSPEECALAILRTEEANRDT